LTFRPGTNLIEGEMEGVGPGPFIRVGEGWAIDNEGMLRAAGLASPERVGSAAVRLGPGRFLVSGAGPPGERDRLQRLRIGTDGRAERTEATDLAGTVTALAADRMGEDARVVAAVAEARRAWIVLLGSFPDARR
jgi:hypothetical protein